MNTRTLFGYHASHEQFSPGRLLQWTQMAEKAGFDCFFSSDHFHPWSERQGQAGFSWTWLGAALQATSIPGRMICCPGYRYHPAMVAQAAATAAEMFDGRFDLALGSGQALNERITGVQWPAKDLRNARLRECADVIRALWEGESVTHRGLVTVEEARLYTLPRQTPRLLGAAVTEATARFVGEWADGLLTTSRPPGDLKRMIDAFREGGGEGKPIVLKVGMSYAETDQLARAAAHEQWRSVAFSNDLLTELRTPAEFDAAGKHVRPEDMDSVLRVSGDIEQHIAWLQADMELGVSEIYLHHVGRDQEAFIERFAGDVMPRLRRER